MKARLHNFIALYFNLSRKEANGFIILCLLIPLFIFLPWIGRIWLSSDDPISWQDQQTLDSLVARIEAHSGDKEIADSTALKKTRKTIVYASFNPNNAMEEEMVSSGVPDFIARRIIKFRRKGGVFKTKEDFKKIYGLSEKTYQQLLPYIRLESTPIAVNPVTKINGSNTKTFSTPFDLNKADSLTLVSLKGIGPVLASRILRYRLRLGGFISLQQLKEVYGLDSMALKEINSYGYIEENFSPNKIDVNSSDEKLLFTHPYIGKKIAGMIFNYRAQHGNFTSPEQLRNIRSIPEQALSKILPYVK